MSDRHILTIDQGTSSTKALLVDESGSIVARASRELGRSFPAPAWVEQDPLEIWASVREAAAGCLAQAPGCAVAAVAVSNQRETVVAWERATGRPLGPAVSWQCQRTAPFCAELRARGLEPLLRERTGLTVDPMFSGSKLRWLLDHVPDGRRRAERGEICLGTVDSWLLWNLTGGGAHACDCTNASRTQLFNLRALDWDTELLDVFGLPRAALPDVLPSSHVFGVTAAGSGLPEGLPVASLIGDSHAALFAHAGFVPGAVKATYGTGSSLMSPTAALVISGRGISSTVAWGVPCTLQAVTYALEGNVYSTGATVRWLGDLLRLPDPDSGVAELAGSVKDTAGVYIVPAFSGLGAPHWNDRARGTICGLTLGATPAHLARAAVESIAYQVRDVFDAMEVDTGARLDVLLADGGATRNDALMRFQADVLARPVLRSRSPELSALGAAYLAGLAGGVWRSLDDIARVAPAADRFEPGMSEAQRDELYAGWREALARAAASPRDLDVS